MPRTQRRSVFSIGLLGAVVVVAANLFGAVVPASSEFSGVVVFVAADLIDIAMLAAKKRTLGTVVFDATELLSAVMLRSLAVTCSEHKRAEARRERHHRTGLEEKFVPHESGALTGKQSVKVLCAPREAAREVGLVGGDPRADGGFEARGAVGLVSVDGWESGGCGGRHDGDGAQHNQCRRG